MNAYEAVEDFKRSLAEYAKAYRVVGPRLIVKRYRLAKPEEASR